MTSAIRAGDTFHSEWVVGGDLTDATVTVVLRRRQMGYLLPPLNLTSTFEVEDGITTVSALLPPDLATGDYAVKLRITRAGDVSSTPSSSNRTITVWP